MTVEDTAIAFEALHAEHRAERLVERVWTLAGCVAELAGEPQEDILARLLGAPAESVSRAALYRYRDDLGEVAEALAREHSRLASSTWRLLPTPAAVADIGPGGPATLDVDIGKVRALGDVPWEYRRCACGHEWRSRPDGCDCIAPEPATEADADAWRRDGGREQ